MNLTPIQQEQVQGTAQQMLALLSDENVNVPANQIEAIVSGKSLLRGIIAGQLIVCQQAPPEEKAPAPDAKADEDTLTADDSP